MESSPAGGKPLVTDPTALRKVLLRLRSNNDSLAFRNCGGLRLVVRNDPDDEAREKWFAFDVSIIISEDEKPCIVRAVKNEIDILEDEELTGFAIIEQYEFREDDTDSLRAATEFINAAALWTVCPCGDYLIKDTGPMCYFCELTRHEDDDDKCFCPICHEYGFPRWMIATACCKQKMHKKCKEACIVSDELRNIDPRCPMCRELWSAE